MVCKHDQDKECWWMAMSKYHKCPYPKEICKHKIGKTMGPDMIDEERGLL